jgi:hypothetical protein
MAYLTAIWHLCLAATSLGSDLHFNRLGTRRRSPFSALSSEAGVAVRQQMASTQWSTERMPVESQWYSGVVKHSSGSRTFNLEPMPECRKPCLWLVESSVPPAKEKYSPPDRLVGMVMSGTVGCFTFDGISMLSTE